MGKIRKYRQKYHLSKVEAAKSVKEVAQAPTLTKAQSKTNLNVPMENIFSGLDISVDLLTKSLDNDFDAKSVASTKSRKELKLEEQHLKKKDKMLLRRERFLQKLHVAQQAMKPEKKKKKKKEKAVFGSINLVEDKLTALESLFPFKKKDKEKKPVVKGIMKMNKRLKKQTVDAKLMKKMLKNKKFSSNSPQNVLDVLKAKVSAERGSI